MLSDNIQPFILNAHGQEYLYKDPVQLQIGESIIMYCHHGCTASFGNLFTELIYKHLVNVFDASELINILKNPTIKGHKYKPLNFVKNNYCQFIDKVPEMLISFYNHPWDQPFRTSVMGIPVVTVPRGTSPEDLADPDISVEFKSFFYAPNGKDVLLSTIIKKIRNYNGGKQFALVIFACREFTDDVLTFQKISEIPSIA